MFGLGSRVVGRAKGGHVRVMQIPCQDALAWGEPFALVAKPCDINAVRAAADF